MEEARPESPASTVTITTARTTEETDGPGLEFRHYVDDSAAGGTVHAHYAAMRARHSWKDSTDRARALERVLREPRGDGRASGPLDEASAAAASAAGGAAARGPANGRYMTVYDALHVLDNFVDASDPDIDLPNSVHAFQTAEGLRGAGESEEMQVVGLIHDLGKVQAMLEQSDERGVGTTQQWATAGDTWMTGAPLPDCLVFPELNELNEDRHDAGYAPGCGLRSMAATWGHDEYLFRTLRAQSTLAPESLYIIRMHSLYPWHHGGAYTEYEDDFDRHMKPIVRKFSSFDLYTKENKVLDTEGLWNKHYRHLVETYVPGRIFFPTCVPHSGYEQDDGEAAGGEHKSG